MENLIKNFYNIDERLMRIDVGCDTSKKEDRQFREKCFNELSSTIKEIEKLNNTEFHQQMCDFIQEEDQELFNRLIAILDSNSEIDNFYDLFETVNFSGILDCFKYNALNINGRNIIK